MSHQDFEDLRRELDRRADRDDAFWTAQRQSIRRRLGAESRPARRRPPVWAFAGLGAAAAGALAALLLFLAPPWNTPTVDVAIDHDTAALLRSVESTLASDLASPLSAADVLLAEMEQQLALLQTETSP